jgi:epsin
MTKEKTKELMVCAGTVIFLDLNLYPSSTVRNRSRELVEMLSDVEKIRAERRKAKANKSKYIGVGNDGFSGSISFESGGGRYGGFGSDSLGGGGGGSSTYGSYGNGEPHPFRICESLLIGIDYSGSSSGRGGGSSSFSDNRRPYEEYNAGEDEVSHTSTPVRSNSTRSAPSRKATAPPPPAPASEPAVDLLGGFEDDAFDAPAPAPVAVNKALPSVSSASVGIDGAFSDLYFCHTKC